MKKILYYFIQKQKLDFKSILNRLTILKLRHFEISAIYSTNNCGIPTNTLNKLFSALILQISITSLKFFENHPNIPKYVNDHGEHYKLLHALVKVLKPKNIVEIGTFTGLSSLTFLDAMDNYMILHTFDIIPYSLIENSAITEKDFKDNNIIQYIYNLNDFENIKKHKNILQNADLIFIDAPKDGVFEKNILINLKKIGIKDKTILMFDDIKQWNMLKIWSDIKMPKIDITAFGHFTGSGLIEYDSRLSFF